MTTAADTSAVEPADPRSQWALGERVRALEIELAARAERATVRELELLAARKDLEVQQAYNHALEQTAEERRGHVTWLQGRLEETGDMRVRAEAAEREREALRAELAAERARVSYRFSQRAIRMVRHTPLLNRIAARRAGRRDR